MNSLLQVEDLKIFVHQNQKIIPVVKGISFEINQGECVGIVGESGCGKTMTAQTIACLSHCPYEGNIFIKGNNLKNKNENEKRELRAKEMGIIFQNPQSALNPTIRVGEQIKEVNSKLKKEDVLKLLNRVDLHERCYHQFPHELSGGICQRIMIAIALAKKPSLLIADEPTTALDVTVQIHILKLIQDLQRESQLGVLLITHDFNVIERICQRVLVMYAGTIVEEGYVNDVLRNPLHPYTKALLESRPILGKGKKHPLYPILGKPPRLGNSTLPCAFAPRCNKALNICIEKKPSLQMVNDKHHVACWRDLKEIK